MRTALSICLAALTIVSIAGGIILGLRFKPALQLEHAVVQGRPTNPSDSQFRLRTQSRDSSESLRTYEQQSNILELPKASTDFVGYWGGYVHSSIQRFSPDLVGTSPDRVSVIFGRRGNTVFMTGELYASAGQRIAQGPRASIVNTRVAVIGYELADKDLYYVCRDTFRLRIPSTINYRGMIDVSDPNSRKLLGIITETAVLKRLLTAREQLEFARPGRNRIPRASVIAADRFSLP